MMRTDENKGITGPAAIGAAEPIRRTTEQTPAQRQEGPAAPASSDRVSTAASAGLEVAVRQARDEAVGARAAQLAAIEADVRKATYRPDPARIAEKILEDAELIARLHAM